MSPRSKRTTRQRIQDMLDAIAEIQRFVAGQRFEDFVADSKTRKAVLADFAIIGEAASHVPEDVVQDFPQVPWIKVRDMRKIVVHVYFAVNAEIVWDTIHADLRYLRNSSAG